MHLTGTLKIKQEIGLAKNILKGTRKLTLIEAWAQHHLKLKNY